MKKSTHDHAPNGTPAPALSSADLAAAQSALTAAGQQYAASNNLSYEDRQDLAEQVREFRATVEQLKDGAE